MVQVKICGMTNLADARAAIEAGADMLGFNFYRPSPRFIEPRRANEIIRAVRREAVNHALTCVGVVANESTPESVMTIVTAADVDAVQLHGDESIEFCARLKQLLPDTFVIKVLRVTDTFDPTETKRYQVDAIMLDAFHRKLLGGTGQVVSWTVARSAREMVPRLFLAGGLSPENVSQAIAAVTPYAVDACSSLESTPGRKVAERMKAFVQAARNG